VRLNAIFWKRTDEAISLLIADFTALRRTQQPVSDAYSSSGAESMRWIRSTCKGRSKSNKGIISGIRAASAQYTLKIGYRMVLMVKNKARHPEDITHHLIRYAVVFFIVSAAGTAYWVVHDQRNDVSVPNVEPMTRQAMPKIESQ
jgi:hypothetical protein